MVLNSTKTYGELMLEAIGKTERQEVGETLTPVLERFTEIINNAVQDNYDKGIRGKYYIHIWINKEPYANNTLHIFPHCRRSRPSPYQGHDHFLWSVEDGGKVTHEWSIPNKETLNYILKHPNKFDPTYVNMLRKYTQDKIEKLDDYLVNGKVV